MFGPKHTVRSVIQQLIEGFENGTVVIDAENSRGCGECEQRERREAAQEAREESGDGSAGSCSR